MPTYLCKIGTADGRVIEKEFTSISKPQLSTDLQDQGFYVFKLRRKIGVSALFKQHSSSRLTGRAFLAFNKEFVVLLRSGLPIVQILDTLIEQMEVGSFREVVTDLREDIKGGSTLSDSFAEFPRFFSPLYVAAVRAGEKTGDLTETLTRFMAYQKRVEEMKAKVRSASFYPLILTSAAFVVVVFLLLYVVPTFTQIYADASVELPLMTQMLIGFSGFVKEYWYLMLVLVALAILFIPMVLRSPRYRLKVDRFILSTPFLGKLTVEYALSSFCRTLGTTLDSGTPLLEAMRMSQGTLNNLSLEWKVVEGIRQVEEGILLTESLDQTGFFPALALRMINVGENSGSLIVMLSEVAEYYENELEQRLTRLTVMIEPILMVVMGVLIAFIIVAMYVPIFQLAGTVG